MKKLLSLIICILLMTALVGCGKQTNSTENQTSGSTQTQTSDSTQSSVPPAKTSVKIFLAGDSTVKTYNDNQYIGGWGQYLQNFLNADKVKVVNKSQGGRSSRSFINEGRLFTNSEIKGSYTSIESEITSGDYLIIQFGHNDDMTRNNFDTYVERQVKLGTPDANGIFPTEIPASKDPNTYIPVDYQNKYQGNEAKLNEARQIAAKYGSSHYSVDKGTFKGYLKMYIDFAREKGAIPILATPVARVSFNNKFDLIGGNGKHGPNFEYVTAVRQLASEENCLLIDLFDFSKNMLETAAKNAQNKAEANYLMALKPNALTGAWPSGYDTDFTEKATGIEGTHYNKFGAYLTAAAVTETLYNFNAENKVTNSNESITFGDYILTEPTAKVVPSTKMQESTTQKLLALLKVIKA